MPGVGVGPKAQKNIKIFGWLGVVIGAINAVLGPLLINFLLNSSEVASQVTVDQSALGVAIAIAVISGLVILGIGAMALRNKNNAQAVKPYLIAGIVATILAILSAMGNGNAPPVLFIIFGAYGGIAYNNIKSGQ